MTTSDTDTEGCTALWLHVIELTVRDLSSAIVADAADARDFFADPARLDPVCEMLSLNPAYLRRKLAPWLVAPSPSVRTRTPPPSAWDVWETWEEGPWLPLA